MRAGGFRGYFAELRRLEGAANIDSCVSLRKAAAGRPHSKADYPLGGWGEFAGGFGTAF
jgi:hypothetical protein